MQQREPAPRNRRPTWILAPRSASKWGRASASLALISLSLLAAQAPSSFAQSVSEDIRNEIILGGLEASSDDYYIKLGGRMQLDAAYFDEDKTSLPSGTDARRLWLELTAFYRDKATFRFAYDFESERTQDAFLRLQLRSNSWLTVGQFKPMVGLSEQSSNNWLTFLERPMAAEAFQPLRALGAGYNVYTPRFTFSLGAFGDSIDSEAEGDDPLRITSRLSYRPRHEQGDLLHLGISGLYQKTDETDTVRFGAFPVARLGDSSRVLATEIVDVDDYTAGNLEVAWVRGPFSVQGEMIGVRLDSPEEEKLWGYYLFASYFVTGESRHYLTERGTFGRPLAKSKGSAIVEVALRFDHLDMNDADAGEADNVTAGLNWYANQHLKIGFMYVFSSIANGINGDEDVHALQARLQWVF